MWCSNRTILAEGFGIVNLFLNWIVRRPLEAVSDPSRARESLPGGSSCLTGRLETR